MASIQVRIDDSIKKEADSLFHSLGFDTSTAVRMFIVSAIAHRGIPFEVKKEEESKGFSPEYIADLKRMWEDPDPTFIEQPEPHFTDRGELFD